jgi:hypothetical protein
VTVPLRVTIDDSRAERRFARLEHRFSNYLPVMRGPVRQLVRRAIIQQYRTRGNYGGEKWVELAESTIRRKQAAGGYSLGPLKFTRGLYESLTVLDHPERREVISKRGYRLRSLRRSRAGFPIGAAHQTGTEDGHVPRRQVIPDPMPASFMRELRSIIRGYLIEVKF